MFRRGGCVLCLRIEHRPQVVELREFLLLHGRHAGFRAIGAHVVEVDLGIRAVDPGKLVLHAFAAFHGEPQQLLDLGFGLAAVGEDDFQQP